MTRKEGKIKDLLDDALAKFMPITETRLATSEYFRIKKELAEKYSKKINLIYA